MKILVNALGTRRGGSEVFITNLLPALASIDPKITIDLLIVDTRASQYSNLPDSVKVIEIAEMAIMTLLKRFWIEHFVVPQLYYSNKYDWYFQADDTLSPAISLVSRKTLVVFQASIQLVFPKFLGDSRFKILYWSLLKRWALYMATVPVTVSFCAKGELARANTHIFRKLQVIYHGIDQEQFKSNQYALQKSSSITLPDKYILSISTRNPHKNYYRLVQAYKMFKDKTDSGEHLVLIGSSVSPAEEKRIRDYIHDHSLEHKVHIFDSIDNSLLPEIYQHATAYIYPSLFDSFGMTPMEAMACGIPCAVSRISALPETCGDAAEYFEPLDVLDIALALQRVITDQPRRSELIALGYKHVQRYSWEEAAKRYYALLTMETLPVWNV